MTSSKHLWEPTHPYYCHASGGNEDAFTSWSEFLEEYAEIDPDMNLLFRWDWDGSTATLNLFWVLQRKGKLRSTMIENMQLQDEAAVRQWLLQKWAHLQDLWVPVSR